MAKTQTKQVFISYSHDSKEHKKEIRKLANDLITDYGIDVFADFYEEDNPTGSLLTDFMQGSRKADRIICVLTPNYKLKAKRGVGASGLPSLFTRY